jgi:hypothetical protein
MFASCESTEWGAGVAAALEGCTEPAKVVQLLYALDAKDALVKVANLLGDLKITQVLRTAHKLNCRTLIEVSAVRCACTRAAARRSAPRCC